MKLTSDGLAVGNGVGDREGLALGAEDTKAGLYVGPEVGVYCFT
jgi:hypothetical protein